MYEVKINGQDPLNIDATGSEITVNGEAQALEIVELGEGTFQVIRLDGAVTVHVVEVNAEEKTVDLLVNGKKVTAEITTELDRLLEKMGLADALSSRISEIKAPMPGLIHSVSVAVGQEVAKGDALLILEAMKMENVIKSPDAGTVAAIHIDQGQSVEKNQLLISFE